MVYEAGGGKCMHLAIDALGTKRGGAATCFLDFLNVAVADSRVEKITVFSSPAADRLFAFPQSRKLQIVEKTIVDRNPLARVWWYEFLSQRHVAAFQLTYCSFLPISDVDVQEFPM